MNIANRLPAILFVAVAIAGGSFFFYQGLLYDRDQPESATVWPTPKPLPEFNLTEHSGKPFGKGALSGRWSLLFFGFTHCPDICPATLQQLAIVQSKLTESGYVAPKIVLISVDPDRDTPAALATYVEHFGENISGVTGNIAELRKLTSAAGIFFAKAPAENGSYTVDHSAVVLLVNPDAAIHASFSAPHKIEEFVHDLPLIVSSL